MAKTLAVLRFGVVTNLVWCSDSVQETDSLKPVGRLNVQIGDFYQDGKFYHDGTEIQADTEQIISDLTIERDLLLDNMAQLIEEIYAMDLEMMEE